MDESWQQALPPPPTEDTEDDDDSLPRGRAICPRCRRPSLHDCLCSALPSQPLSCHGTVIILQNRQECKRTLGTAPLLAASLRDVHIVRGNQYKEGKSAVLDDAVATAKRPENPVPLFVLWPGPTAVDVRSVSLPPSVSSSSSSSPQSPSWTLVALDGTWQQACEMSRSFLPALCPPGVIVSLSPPSSSPDPTTLLRAEPGPGLVVTCEAVARAAAALEAKATGDEEGGRELEGRLLKPLRLLVSLQRLREEAAGAEGKGVKADASKKYKAVRGGCASPGNDDATTGI